MDPITPPKEKNLEYYFDYEDKLYNLSGELVTFSPIQDEYINKEKLKEDVYTTLEAFLIRGNINWDELAKDINPIELLNEEYNLKRLRNDILDIILSFNSTPFGVIAKNAINQSSYAYNYSEAKIYRPIYKVIYELIEDYKKSIKDISKRKL